MDMDGSQNAIVRMLAGESIKVNVGTFSNDMITFATKDDVLTLLVHLGYLNYDGTKEMVSIPNKEVAQEYVNVISTMNWHGVADSVESSRKLLEALWEGMQMPWQRELRKHMMKFQFYNIMTKIHLAVRLILHFILQGNIIR